MVPMNTGGADTVLLQYARAPVQITHFLLDGICVGIIYICDGLTS